MNIVQRVRKKTGLSQSQFSSTYDIPLATLQNWEQGRRVPDDAALSYLKVIEKMLEAITKTLSE